MRPAVVAQLSVRRGREAVEFYTAAFGAVEVYRVGGDDANPSVVSPLTVGDATFWVADESPEHGNFSPETVGGGTVRMLLVVDDPDAAVRRAVEAGAAGGYPVREGHRRGGGRDGGVSRRRGPRLADGPDRRPVRPPLGGRAAARRVAAARRRTVRPAL